MDQTQLAEEFLVRDVRTLKCSDTIETLIAVLAESPQEVFPVLDAKGALAGTVSELDLLRVLDPAQRTLSFGPAKLIKEGFASEVEDIMTPRPLTVPPDEPIHAVLKRMATMRTPHLIVTDKEGRILGVIRARDLYRAFAGRS